MLMTSAETLRDIPFDLNASSLMETACVEAGTDDEREFADPDRFDIHRRAPRIISFNPGRHICLGIHVAQMEGRILTQELLARAPDYEIDAARAVRVRSEMFRGFSCLPITFKPN